MTATNDTDWERKGLTGPSDQAMLDLGHPRECVTWVCAEHRRHCTHLGTEHTEHECYFCHLAGETTT